ncbi:hypothetical protein Murru_1793 [Allomuricauda ruestringensis DSM 13258]|uniref:Cardiolipin synthetase n=1 Tax=Allomuricauda ruestringensis (strain DSM 13258 / CIP 107369 / LMG 19739 / B1) TaxID=886377 RepID=G2PJA6_ALLRU|nr:hypothetical protein [Allomuricauda ruestringensis]AEM70833.1 hypothetical protein Murru_1793 [Allomuricauda ruestringensis DSM 13258]
MKLKLIGISLLLLMGCSSTRLVSTWKNPDIVLFDAYQVLVVGMVQDDSARMEFESRFADALKDQGVDAMRSIDLFDVEFTSSQRSEQELEEVEQQLLDKGFDAILFTKVVGTENRRTFREHINEVDKMLMRFSTDYLEHQEIYYDPEYYDTFNIYHAETSLYCICVGKEIELVWRGEVDVTEPTNVDKAIGSYVKLVTKSMGEEDVIF